MPFATQAALAAILMVTPAGHADSFDRPLHKQFLDLGASRNLMRNDARHVSVTCWYYNHFMVKEQNDPGVKGAISIAIAPSRPGHRTRCVAALQPGEKEFTEWSGEYKEFVRWNGYFAGVKHDLIFLERPDGDENGGILFAAFLTDGRTKFFEDSVTLEANGARNLSFVPTPANEIVLHYLRVASAGCSIPRLGKSCWGKLRQQTQLTHSPMPKCTDYEGTQAGSAPSIIAYPVEATLYPKPSVRPLGGPVRCYPQQ